MKTILYSIKIIYECVLILNLRLSLDFAIVEDLVDSASLFTTTLLDPSSLLYLVGSLKSIKWDDGSARLIRFLGELCEIVHVRCLTWHVAHCM